MEKMGRSWGVYSTRKGREDGKIPSLFRCNKNLHIGVLLADNKLKKKVSIISGR
jgi:hypothetical protein